MALQPARSPGQQFHLAAAVIITVNMIKKQNKKTNQAASLSAT